MRFRDRPVDLSRYSSLRDFSNVCNWRKADKGFGNWEKDRKRTNCVGQRNHVFSSVLLVDFHRKVGSDVAGLAAEWQVRYNQ